MVNPLYRHSMPIIMDSLVPNQRKKQLIPESTIEPPANNADKGWNVSRHLHGMYRLNAGREGSNYLALVQESGVLATGKNLTHRTDSEFETSLDNTGETPVVNYLQIISQVWWHMPVFSATRKAEEGGSPEPGRLKLQSLFTLSHSAVHWGTALYGARQPVPFPTGLSLSLNKESKAREQRVEEGQRSSDPRCALSTGNTAGPQDLSAELGSEQLNSRKTEFSLAATAGTKS
ncbi:hypothetical protein AAY473_001377 [Plecturocebus cupreus]